MDKVVFTPVQLAEFYDELEKRRQRLQTCLQNQRVVHAAMISLVGCTAERDVDGRTIQSERRQLAEIESALQRFEDGSYGLCTKCGRAILPMRLRAAPAIRFCRACSADSKPVGSGVQRRPVRTADASS